jgi:hypothetical protein
VVRNIRTPTRQEADGLHGRLGVCMSTAQATATHSMAHLNVAALELRVFELELREPCIIAGAGMRPKRLGGA